MSALSDHATAAFSGSGVSASLTFVARGSFTACSIAVILYFRRFHRGSNLVTTFVAPLLVCAGLIAAIVLLYKNLSFIAPGGSKFVDALPWIALAVPIIGIAYAYYLRARRKSDYERLGRMVNSGEIL